MDLSGIWKSNDGAVYFIRQVGDDIWWIGEKAHYQWVNLFIGKITDETLTGEWVDLPKGQASSYGELTLNIQNNKITCRTQSGNFPSWELKKENMLSMLSNIFNNQGEFINAGFSIESDLTGCWLGNDSGFYYLREIDNTIWWFAEHPKRNWTHVFKGKRSGSTITGEWIDLPKGKTSGKGTLELEINFPNRSLRKTNESGGFPGTGWSKLTGDYTPGEARFDSDFHPDAWSIRWDQKVGLNLDAFDSLVRSPYIQNITTDSATVIWRVSIPKGTNPGIVIPNLKAEALIAPLDTPIANGKKYTLQNGIIVKDVSWTYQYQDGSLYDINNCKINKKELNRLSSQTSRPIIQFSVRFRDLEPGKVYHYRIKSDTTDPNSGLNEENTKYYTLADDVFFRTAPDYYQNRAVRFLAMGDLGPGNNQPDYFYDVNDLFQDVARKYGPDLWLALGDIENSFSGHPNAMDPYFFNVYNAHHDHNLGNPPRWTSPISFKAKETKIKAFQKPPYFGLLGGLPVYPAFGNRDLGPNKPSLENWRKSYRGNFEFPSADLFNQAGQGFFYSFRYGNVIFISLGIPGTSELLGIEGNSWRSEWGDRQRSYLKAHLDSLRNESDAPDVWIVVYFHDHHWGYTLNTKEQQNFSEFLAESGVDIVLMGHQHFFAHKTIKRGDFDYRAIVVGTGGYGENFWHGSNTCKRPGFIMANVKEDIFEYWKFDTHRCKTHEQPEERSKVSPLVREYCSIKKLGFGKHEVKELDLNAPYFW